MIEKINKIGRIGRIISKIGKVLLLLAMIVCVVVGIFLSFIPKESAYVQLSTSNSAVVHIDSSVPFIFENDNFNSVIEIEGNTYQLVDDNVNGPMTVERTIYIHNLKWAMVIGVVVCGVYYSLLFFLGKICQALEVCETPFTEDVSKALEYLAYAMIAMVVVNSYGASLINGIVTSVWDITIQIDLAVILLILCIFLLVQIFKYGTMLQIESDETL